MMGKWPVCPKCNKEMKPFKIKGDSHYPGVVLEGKCEKCGAIYLMCGNGQTQLVHP